MRNLYFLVSVLIVLFLLPLDTVAQKRPVKVAKKIATSSKSKKVKRTGLIRKRVVRKKTGIQPVAMLNGRPTATIIPNCNLDEGRVVFTVAFYRLTTNFMKLNGPQVQLKLGDGAWSSQPSDVVAQGDLRFAQMLFEKIKPREMEIYPAVQSPKTALLNMLVFIKDKWTAEELGEIKKLIVAKLGPDVGTTYIAFECATLFWDTQPQLNLVEAKPSPTPQ